MSAERKIKRDQGFKKQKLAKSKARRDKLASERRIEDHCSNSRRNDLLPDLVIEFVEIDTLRPDPKRTRKTSPEQLERLVAAMAEFGFRDPVLVWNGFYLDGHVRIEAARRHGIKRIPAISCNDLSEAAARKLAITSNRLAELGTWDFDQLKLVFEELIVLGEDLVVTGFSAAERDIILLDVLEEDDKANNVPEPRPVPITHLGDKWHLCEHILVCGSALEEATYANLLGGTLVHAVLSDLPYNVKIKGNVSGLGKTVHDEFVMASGELNDPEWQSFLDTTMAHFAAVVEPGGVIFAFMDWRSIHRLYLAGFAAGLNLINLAVWYKEAGGMGSLYRSAHELIPVFCNGDKPRINAVELGRQGRDRQNVWCAPSANKRGSSANLMLKLHSTPKPVELCCDAILDVTEPGDIVLDGFLGSGTTLIAAEKTGRRCRGIELDPKYVDVTIRRWEEFTGKEAVLAETGETFAEVTARRRGEDPAGDESEADAA